MKKVLLSLLALLILAGTVLQPLPVYALEPVDLTRKGSLALEYSKDGTGFSDLEIQIYRVARMETNGTAVLIDPFDGFPVSIDGITSQKEWRDTANTLASYILAEGIDPYASAVADNGGNVCFADLETGVYLVMGVSAVTEAGTYRFENFCQFMPTPGSYETKNYEVSAKPKSTFTPKPQEPEYQQYQVVKLWKDAGNSRLRPKNVTVEILKNGDVVETIRLNEENNWSYSWSAPVGQDVWTVVEKDVPDAYTVAISSSANGFAITNTRTVSGGNPPKTGDMFALRPWVTAMSLSGMLLMAVGMLYKRKGR